MAVDLIVGVVGMGGVGKTSALIRYIKDEFNEEYNPTVSDNFIKKINIERARVKVEFLDTAGQHEFALYRDSQLERANAFLVVYAIDDARSFEEAKKIVAKYSGQGKCIRVVGNKSDLESSRAVPFSTAKAHFDSLSVGLGECSAKAGDAVTANVEELVRDALRTIDFRDHRRQSCVIA